MEKTKRYEIEGRILDIPVHWDERSQQYLEDYSSLIENSLLGVCHNEKTRSDAGPAQLETNVKKEEKKP